MRINTNHPEYRAMKAALHENLDHAIRCMEAVQNRQLDLESYLQTRAELVEAIGLICEGFFGEDPLAENLDYWLDKAGVQVNGW